MQSSKVHHYPFTFRSAIYSSTSLSSFCQDKAYFYLVPPRNALTIENLFLHFRMKFDAAIASGDRVLQYVGVANEIPLLIGSDPSRLRKIDFNLAADGSRYVDVHVDLTPLLNKSHCRYRDYFGSFPEGDYTYIVIKLADACRGVTNVGTVEKWKADALFATEEIR